MLTVVKLINWAKTNNLKIVTVGSFNLSLMPVPEFNELIKMFLIILAECLGDSNGAYQSGNFTSNGQSTC